MLLYSTPKKFNLLGALLLCLSGCGGGGSSSESGHSEAPAPTSTAVTTIKLTGAVEKGPFVTGSSVVVVPLTDQGKTTRGILQTHTVDNFGNFSLNIEHTGFLQLTAKGQYRNEISGRISRNELVLKSITKTADNAAQTTNINLLTHLAHERILHLIQSGERSADNIIETAESELLSALDEVIPSASENTFALLSLYTNHTAVSSAYLLALSALFSEYTIQQADKNSTTPTLELQQLLNTIASDFATDGKLDDQALLADLKSMHKQINPDAIEKQLNLWATNFEEYQAAAINEAIDSDLDGIFNHKDDDDDNDGLADKEDAFPYVPGYAVGDQSIELDEDQPVTLNLTANKPLGQENQLSITQQPHHGTLSGAYPELTYTPNDNYAGVDEFYYTLNQGEGTLTSQKVKISLTINPVNDRPVISGHPATTVMAKFNYQFVPAVLNVEKNPLTFSIENKPEWASFDEKTGHLSGTPSNDHAGQYSKITIGVSDGETSMRLPAFDIQVLPGFIINNQKLSMLEDDAVTIDITANNPLGKETITATIVEEPKQGTLSGEYPTLTYTPNDNYAGVDKFQYKLIQGHVESDVVNIDITINPVNDRPIISGNPATRIMARDTYSFTPTVINIDGDKLIFSIINKPEWASFDDSTGRLYGTPKNTDAKKYEDIIISVSDGELSASLAPYKLTVLTHPWEFIKHDDLPSSANASLSINSNKLYISGGYKQLEPGMGETINYLTIFNLWDQSVVIAEDIPTARRSHTSHIINNTLFLIGGLNSSGEPIASVEKLDLTTNKWSQASSLLQERSLHASCEYNNKIYVFGGYVYEDHPRKQRTTVKSSNVEMYDMNNDTWTNKASALSTGSTTTCAVFNDNIYVVFSSHNSPASFDIYDPKIDKWAKGKKIPYDGIIPSLLSLKDGIYLITNRNKTFFWKPDIDHWEVKKPMLKKGAKPLRYFGSSHTEEALYIFGGYVDHGYNESTTTNSLKIYTPSLDQ